jgi:proton glutamate symport protein
MKKLGLTAWIFIALVLGVVIGLLITPDQAKHFKIASNVFIKLIKSIVAPLLFATLVVAWTHAAPKDMARIFTKALIYFEVVTTIALFVGLGFVNTIQPGAGVQQPDKVEVTDEMRTNAKANKVTAGGIIEHAFPTSVIDAMAKNDVLQLVVFCMLFGMSCMAVGAKAKPVVDFCQSLAEVMFKYTHYVMYAAPIGVGAAIAYTVGTYGVKVLVNLGQLVGTMFAALAFFVIIVLGAVMLIFRIPIKQFIAAAKDPYILAFSTASSEAALPMALENMEKFGVPKHIVSFVMPMGYSLNLDGSTLYLAAASIFVAQAANHPLDFGTQLAMMLTLMLTSKGVAAVPRASLVILMGTLTTFDLPDWPVSLILGVDAILDMARTSVNLLGNCLATAVIARWEGHKFAHER